MALTELEIPRRMAPRGQKLFVVYSSDETAQNGFKYGVSLTETWGANKNYTFYVSPAPDGNLYFDVASILAMKNDENSDDGFGHDRPTQLEYEEANGKGMKRFTLVVSEWWLVGNVLTENEGTAVTTNDLDFVNAYYQFSDGYRPDNQSGGLFEGYALTGNTSRMWSDRTTETHNWQFADTFSITGAIYIPCRNADYGLLTWINQSVSFASNLATHIKITLFNSAGVPSSVLVPGFTTTEDSFIHQGIYPMNINDSNLSSSVKPASNANWRFYTVVATDSGGTNVYSETYCFYNADLYGQSDCKFDNVRLGWKNSRAGWDYFNFIKKSEKSYQMESKQYRKVLFNGTDTIFAVGDRGLVDRTKLVEQVTTITSDWLQEGEFEFLKSLFVSDQVHQVNDDGTFYSIIITEQSYQQRTTRDGKLYNLTLSFRNSIDYWT